jgi:hypothetical protein
LKPSGDIFGVGIFKSKIEERKREGLLILVDYFFFALSEKGYINIALRFEVFAEGFYFGIVWVFLLLNLMTIQIYLALRLKHLTIAILENILDNIPKDSLLFLISLFVYDFCKFLCQFLFAACIISDVPGLQLSSIMTKCWDSSRSSFPNPRPINSCLTFSIFFKRINYLFCTTGHYGLAADNFWMLTGIACTHMQIYIVTGRLDRFHYISNYIRSINLGSCYSSVVYDSKLITISFY